MPIENLDAGWALSGGEFLPHFQPLVNLRTNRLQGFEILARWNHAERGLLLPAEFISVAERDGWIGQLTSEMLRQGLPAVAAQPGPPMVSVNISPVQLQDLNLPDQIEGIANQCGFSLEHLTIEITESALTNDLGRAVEIAMGLKAMGCKLALDDFGTGYSSLSSLQSIPFDELKVDRSFVRSMTERRDSRKIVAAVVGLGQSLGLLTVAEGVETLEQAEMLLWLGCELGQGWLYGRPMPAEMLPDFVPETRRTMSPGPMSAFIGRESNAFPDHLPALRLAQLQAVYDGAPVGLAFLDRSLRYMNVNRSLANMNGRSMEEHLGRTVQEIIPELFPQVEPYIRRALQGEAITGVEITKPSTGANPGRTILLSYEPARDEAGEVVGVSVALVDLTPIKLAQEAHRETEEHFRHILEILPQIPWIIDPEGRALDVSQRWLEVTGTTDEQWKGFGWMDALHPNDRQPTWDGMQRSFKSGDPIDVTYRVRRSEHANWIRLRSRGSARVGPDGRIVCWYGWLEAVDDKA